METIVNASYTGIEALASRLRAKAKLTASHYRRRDIGVRVEEEWPRDAEVELIESLVRAKAKEVTGREEIPPNQWTPCKKFAHGIMNSRKGSGPHEAVSTDEAQRRYLESEADFFDGIVIWVDHTMDYVAYLSAHAPAALPKQCILFLAANPSDTTRLRLDKELLGIREEMERAGYRDRFDIEARGAVRVKDIVRALLDFTPAYVHFSGHGTEDGAICVEDEDTNGTTHEITPDGLASLFAEAGEGIRCVLLNACFSEAQAKAIAQSVPYVVGMKTSISDEAAIAFATGFYRAIGAAKDVPTAFRLGLVDLKLYGIPEHDTPVIVNRQQGSQFKDTRL